MSDKDEQVECMEAEDMMPEKHTFEDASSGSPGSSDVEAQQKPSQEEQMDNDSKEGNGQENKKYDSDEVDATPEERTSEDVSSSFPGLSNVATVQIEMEAENALKEYFTVLDEQRKESSDVEAQQKPSQEEQMNDDSEEAAGSEDKTYTLEEEKVAKTDEENTPQTLTTEQIKFLRSRRERDMRNTLSEQKDRRQVESISGWNLLEKAMRRNDILEGRITSGKIIKGNVFAVVQTGIHYRVLIPFKDIYVNFPVRVGVDTSTPEGNIEFQRRQTAMLEKLYGAKTLYVVKRMKRDNAGNYVIIGSRSEALLRRSHEYFTPDSNGVSVMAEGDIVSSQIVSVSNHAVAVNVGGIDTRIDAFNLTFRYIPTGADIAEYFSVGEDLLVRITKVTVDEKGHYQCRVSHRDVEVIEAKSRRHLFGSPGDIAYATVTNIVRNKTTGNFSVLLYLDEFDIPAFAANIPVNATGRYPCPGDKVRISFARFSESSGLTQVNIRGIHGFTKL